MPSTLHCYAFSAVFHVPACHHGNVQQEVCSLLLNCIYLPGSGGVGSTELSNFLTQAGLRCNLLTDQDAIRHVNRQVQQLER